MIRFVSAVLVSTVILFLWSGATQMFPWGVPSSQNISVQTNEDNVNTQVANLVRLSSGSLTTEEFDAHFINKVSTYSTDESFSWIVTQPFPTNYTGYFIN